MLTLQYSPMDVKLLKQEIFNKFVYLTFCETIMNNELSIQLYTAHYKESSRLFPITECPTLITKVVDFMFVEPVSQ
jgi:hypothetical protein